MRDDESVRSGGTETSGSSGSVLRKSPGSNGLAATSPPLSERSVPAGLSWRRAGGAAKAASALSSRGKARAAAGESGNALVPGAGVSGGGPSSANGASGVTVVADASASRGYTPLSAEGRAQMDATRDAAIERMWATQV